MSDCSYIPTIIKTVQQVQFA